MKKVFISFVFVILIFTAANACAFGAYHTSADILDFSAINTLHEYSTTSPELLLAEEKDVSEFTGLNEALEDSETTTIDLNASITADEDLSAQQSSSLTIYGNGYSLTGSNTAGFILSAGQTLTLSNISTISGFSGTSGGAIYVAAGSSDTAVTITNVVFTGNSAEQYGGAIYADILNLYADGGTTSFSGNYITSGDEKVYQAIYISSSSGLLTLTAQDSGSIVFDDAINGETGYKIELTTDSSSTITFKNAVSNAQITLNSGNLILSTGTDASGNSTSADFTYSTFNAAGGSISMLDDTATVYSVGTLTSSSSVLYSFDAEFTNGDLSTDILLVNEGSSGTITVSTLGNLSIDDFDLNDLIENSYTAKLLERYESSDDIVLALSSSLISEFSKEITIENYYDSTNQVYTVSSSDFTGSFGISLNDTADSIIIGLIEVYDTLAAVNQYTAAGDIDRYFIIESGTTYAVSQNTGTTGTAGTMYVQGGGSSIIDYGNSYSGFVIPSGATVDISGVSFQNAISSLSGGVINNAGTVGVSSTSGIVNSEFTGNSATFGGAIYNTGTINTISGTNFTSNMTTAASSSTYGGAIYNTGTITSIEGGVFSGNYSTSSYFGYGGAIYNTGTIGYISASFYDNYATGSAAYGGAIYSSTDLTLLADNADYVFSGNYTQTTGSTSKTYNAIYMNSYSSTLTIQAENGGSWTLYDPINGAYGYTVYITSSDGTGKVNLYTQIDNANVITSNVIINVANDDTYTTYTFNTLTSSETNLILDVSYTDKTSDVISVSSGSTGTITIYDIVGVEKEDITDETVTIKVLDKDDSSSIGIEISQELYDEFLYDVDTDDYLDSSSNTYIVYSTDYIGTVGISVNSSKDSIVFGKLEAIDALAMINQLESSEDRYFIFSGADEIYTAIASTGTTGLTGKMYVQGVASGSSNSTVDYTGKYSGFIISSNGTLTIANVTFTNAYSESAGGMFNNTGVLVLDNVVVNNATIAASSTVYGGVFTNRADISTFSASFTNSTITPVRAGIYSAGYCITVQIYRE